MNRVRSAPSWQRFLRHYLLMLRPHHGPGPIVEMAAAMLLPTLAGVGLHALGGLATDQVMTVAHVGMLPAMLLAMLRRYRHYAT